MDAFDSWTRFVDKWHKLISLVRLYIQLPLVVSLTHKSPTSDEKKHYSSWKVFFMFTWIITAEVFCF
jgi:hypothetical protein